MVITVAIFLIIGDRLLSYYHNIYILLCMYTLCCVCLIICDSRETEGAHSTYRHGMMDSQENKLAQK